MHNNYVIIIIIIIAIMRMHTKKEELCCCDYDEVTREFHVYLCHVVSSLSRINSAAFKMPLYNVSLVSLASH